MAPGMCGWMFRQRTVGQTTFDRQSLCQWPWNVGACILRVARVSMLRSPNSKQPRKALTVTNEVPSLVKWKGLGDILELSLSGILIDSEARSLGCLKMVGPSMSCSANCFWHLVAAASKSKKKKNFRIVFLSELFSKVANFDFSQEQRSNGAGFISAKMKII